MTAEMVSSNKTEKHNRGHFPASDITLLQEINEHRLWPCFSCGERPEPRSVL